MAFVYRYIEQIKQFIRIDLDLLFENKSPSFQLKFIDIPQAMHQLTANEKQIIGERQQRNM